MGTVARSGGRGCPGDALVVLLAAAACGPSEPAGRAPGAAASDQPTAIASCARCHLSPPPDILPRDRWPAVMRRMGEITTSYPLDVILTPHDVQLATAYYGARAPATLIDSDPALTPSPLEFVGAGLGAPPPQPTPTGYEPPQIANVHLNDLDGDGRLDVLVSDVRLNALTWIHRTGPEAWTEQVLAPISAPARVEVADLDGDGDRDLAVASLGGIVPTEEPIGAVVLLLAESASGAPRFTPRTVLERVPRVCDVRPADLDGDGDLDLVVAQYGLYKTGGAVWLERDAEGDYESRELLQKNGVSHVPVGDLTGDGLPDVLALISQEHEELVLFTNRGRGRFDEQRVYQAPHVMFGLCNLELADLDGDGDLDALFTNGDALDQDPFPKPWHGVRWLENRTVPGERPAFEVHELVRFPGAYCAAARDLDGDGDLDVVVGSMLNRWADPTRLSLIWLENLGGARFETHPIDSSPTYLVSVDAGDVSGDGTMDVVAGALYVMQPYFRIGRVTVWSGQR